MIPIFVESSTAYAGRTFIALGLLMKLLEQGYKTGYIKPFGKTPVKKNNVVYDADAVFIKDVVGLAEPLDIISPFVRTYETEAMLIEGKTRDMKRQVMAAYKTLKKKDFVIISGAGDFFEGSLFGMSSLSLIEDMNARLVLVEPWRGDTSADSLFGSAKLFGQRFAGGVINKVPHNVVGHVKETLRPFLEKKGVSIYGVFAKERILDSVTVRQLIEILSGRVLCCTERLDEYVENYSIGAMDVDTALNYFRRIPNKAVITGAHRSDIQLAAMETSTKCIILTGGLQTNAVVIGKAQSKNIPIISVADDTFTTVEKIEAGMGRTNIRDKRKIARVKELMDLEFDMKRFLRTITRGPASVSK